MADIKIEKKESGSLWWLWAIIAVIILALLLWWLLGSNDNDGAVDAPTVATAPVQGDMSSLDQAASTDDQAITDLATITGATGMSLVGRDVRLNGVPVGSLTGDASFWVSGADGQKVYVVLDEVATPETSTEGRFDVNPGDSVDVVGTLRSASDGAPDGAAAGSTTDALPDGVTQYIYAQSAKVAG